MIRADSAKEIAPALDAMQAAADAGRYLAGFLSYELGYALEDRLAALMPEERNVPLLWFGVFDDATRLTGGEITDFLTSASSGTYDISAPALTLNEADYAKRFERVKRYISAGDIYQLNLTLKGSFSFSGDPYALYADLRRKQPVSYASFIDTGEMQIISASPELFLSLERDRIATRPMKGTAPRALTLEADRETSQWLSDDLKSRAENLMIVDLMRNDIGRVSETGSVRVSDLFTVETYETLHQMTSGVEARLKKDTSFSDLLRNVFPAGSITGAPKVRAMEIISELESHARGVYTGSVGYIAPDGRASFNVAIRTLSLFEDGRGEVGIGSGVVHDSKAQAEYDECLLKMRFLTEPVRDFQLIETMLYEPGNTGYALLDRHMARLQASAEYFLFPFPQDAIQTALQARTADMQDGPYRVRLLLFHDGHFELTQTSIAGVVMNEVSYVVSGHRLDSGIVFLFHKTTERQLFDDEWARTHEEQGADEVIFLNERGEVCEGSRMNIFVRKGAKLLTPALSCGLLPGTLREELLASGEAVEAVLTLDDLSEADAVYLGNSVRGLLPAHQHAPTSTQTAAE